MPMAPVNVFGDPDEKTREQMEFAANLDPVVAGALMPDAHLGYGLPIGGVIVCEHAVMPYAVGFDIACRMKLSFVDTPIDALDDKSMWLQQILQEETRFGVGASFEPGSYRDHPVLDDPLWAELGIDEEKLRAQLGTSGSGNHFVDFGIVEYEGERYFGILSHSGSRGAGHQICTKYAAIAKEKNPEGGDLAWLDFFSNEGQEYWMAMQLAGQYASANHACIHDAIVARLGAEVVGGFENHHNFAWMEGGKVVHRKGATPAHLNEYGVVPGTMADKSYIVRGLGIEDGLFSSAHGAGRAMGRKAAKRELCQDEWKKLLVERNVVLIGGDLDEAPGAYKNIDEVIQQQDALAEPVGTFTPRIVRMA